MNSPPSYHELASPVSGYPSLASNAYTFNHADAKNERGMSESRLMIWGKVWNEWNELRSIIQ
jgi:hypothetical protein